MKRVLVTVAVLVAAALCLRVAGPYIPSIWLTAACLVGLPFLLGAVLCGWVIA